MPDAQSIESSLSGSIQVLVETVALQRARADKAESTLRRVRALCVGVGRANAGDRVDPMADMAEAVLRVLDREN